MCGRFSVRTGSATLLRASLEMVAPNSVADLVIVDLFRYQAEERIKQGQVDSQFFYPGGMRRSTGIGTTVLGSPVRFEEREGIIS